MTKVTVYKSSGRYTGFSCQGHAGYAAYSEDIVCASISVLVINTINSIETLTMDIPLVNSQKEDGVINCSFQSEVSPQTTLLIDAMLLGLTEIKKQYGKKYLEISYKEV